MQKVNDRDVIFEKGIFVKQFPIKDEYEANNPSQSYFPQNNVFNKQS